VSKEAVALFEKYKVLNGREVQARYEIMVETYNKTVNVEGQLMVLMANRYILPAALEYQKQVAQSVAAVKSAGGRSAEGKKLLDVITRLVDQLKQRSDKLAHALEHESPDAVKHAKHFRDVVIPAMGALREAGDAIELTMPHETWPLATYREMLFIK
jgi:glutamine synthetase